uniref:Uncharacterized protein n=1 Tax=Arundo donax TaxID=35708 RepID=A0A0A9FRK3_ARUDO
MEKKKKSKPLPRFNLIILGDSRRQNRMAGSYAHEDCNFCTLGF